MEIELSSEEITTLINALRSTCEEWHGTCPDGCDEYRLEMRLTGQGE